MITIFNSGGCAIRTGKNLRTIQRHSLRLSSHQWGNLPEGWELDCREENLNGQFLRAYNTKVMWQNGDWCTVEFLSRDIMFRWMLRNCAHYTPRQTHTVDDVVNVVEYRNLNRHEATLLAYEAGYQEAKRTAWATKRVAL